MVWGTSLPGTPAVERAPPTPAPQVSPARILAGLVLVGALTWTLASIVGMGPNLDVVLGAAFGSAVAILLGRGAGRIALITLLVVALTGIGWIELINTAQYGTLSLTGAPPLVRWCGTTYRPSGVVTADPSAGAGPRYTKILHTPSGYDVFGVALGARRSCGTSATIGPLFVAMGRARYAAYDPVTTRPVAPGPMPLTSA
ncbi:MAG: hypothetical protein ABSC30_12055 [Acidimicrobiales bacterium]